MTRPFAVAACATLACVARAGVVGPSGKRDASATRFMITHDFVHKTHLRIFETYYPSVLSDWWMDDWISHVYPADNARKVPSLPPSRPPPISLDASQGAGVMPRAIFATRMWADGWWRAGDAEAAGS